MTSNDEEDEDREWETLRRAVEGLGKLRIHLVIAHDVKKNRDCKYENKWHWNTELSEITKDLAEFEAEEKSE